jgi:hypothetical protein
LLAREQLRDLLSKPDFTKTEKLLICLAVEADLPKPVEIIKKLGISAGLLAIKKWNVSQLLSGSRGLAARTAGGWELTTQGRERVRALIGPVAGSPVAHLLPQLRTHLSKVKNADVAAFIEEAIKALELGLLRAGVVLSWVGAVAVLYDHVISKHLAQFNAEALKRDPKWRPAKSADDLARMKEADFLVVLESASVIGKSVKQELEGCLKLRNGAGHPNQLKIGESRAAAHVETLMLNVFAVFA